MNNSTRVNRSLTHSNTHKNAVNLRELKQISLRHYESFLDNIIQKSLADLEVNIIIDSRYLIKKLNLNKCEWSSDVREKIEGYSRSFLINDFINHLLDKMPPVHTSIYKRNQNLNGFSDCHIVLKNTLLPIYYYDFKSEVILSFTCLRIDRLSTLIHLTLGIEIKIPETVTYNIEYVFDGVSILLDKQHHVHIRGIENHTLRQFIVKYIKSKSKRSIIINH